VIAAAAVLRTTVVGVRVVVVGTVKLTFRVRTAQRLQEMQARLVGDENLNL